MDERDRVAAFLADHDIESPPAYRVLDPESEVGEITKEVTTSAGYGARPNGAAVAPDEIGDALFAPLAVADAAVADAADVDAADVDAGEALDVAIEKYERRIDESGDAGSN